MANRQSIRDQADPLGDMSDLQAATQEIQTRNAIQATTLGDAAQAEAPGDADQVEALRGAVKLYQLVGSEVTVPRNQWIVLKKDVAGLFAQKLASLVFGKEVLAKSMVPDVKSKRPPLDQTKFQAVIRETLKQFPEAEMLELIDAIQQKCYNAPHQKNKT